MAFRLRRAAPSRLPGGGGGGAVLKGFPDLRTFGSSVVHSLDVVHLDSILPQLCPIESIPLSRPRAVAYCFSVIPPRIPSVGLELGNSTFTAFCIRWSHFPLAFVRFARLLGLPVPAPATCPPALKARYPS